MAKLKAGVRRRDNGTFEKRFTINGKRYSIYAPTTKELEEREQKLRQEISSGTYTKNKQITLNAYFDVWKERKKSTVKSNSLYSYCNSYEKYFRDTLGKKKMQEIEKREIEELKLAIAKGGKDSKNCNRALLVLKMIFRDAVNDEIIAVNPATKVKNIKIQEVKKATKTIHRALTQEEQKAFFDECRECNSFYLPYYSMLILTGMRSGELSALTWADIDYKHNVIHITKTVTKDENGKVILGDTPKSSAGVRDVPLLAQTKELLAQYKKDRYGNIVPMGERLVFTGMYGDILCNPVINGNIKNILSRLEKKGTHIETFTAHAFRDTFATRFIEQGGTPQTLKTILGHERLSVTMDLYAHVLDDTKQREMQKLNIVI